MLIGPATSWLVRGITRRRRIPCFVALQGLLNALSPVVVRRESSLFMPSPPVTVRSTQWGYKYRVRKQRWKKTRDAKF